VASNKINGLDEAGVSVGDQVSDSSVGGPAGAFCLRPVPPLSGGPGRERTGAPSF
jgi:hypothetical protein